VDDLSFARAQMAMSLAFHIVFAVVGITMPVLMAVAGGAYLCTRKPVF
jgi:cytochrome d ubiquinol oxidase subunit I